MGFPGGSLVKNPSGNAGDTKDMGLISVLGRSPEEGYGNISIIAWRIPWTEEPGRLYSMGSYRVRHDWCDLSHMKEGSHRVYEQFMHNSDWLMVR